MKLNEIVEFDLLFYKTTSLLRFFKRYEFSHVAIALRDSKNNMRQYGSVKGWRIGFRPEIGTCHVCSFKGSDALKKKLLQHKGELYSKYFIQEMIGEGKISPSSLYLKFPLKGIFEKDLL